MRSTFSFARMFSLLWIAGTLTAGISIASADTSSTPSHHIQIRCFAIRVRMQDIDDLGINCDLMPAERLPKSAVLSLPSDAPPGFATFTNGTNANKMFDQLTKLHYSVFSTPLVTSVDGQSKIISLSKLKDPGTAAASQLIVTPHLHNDGTIGLYISPQFRFVVVPSPDNNTASVSMEAFPWQRTLSSGTLLAFTVVSHPVPGHRFGQYLPIIPSVSNKGHLYT